MTDHEGKQRDGRADPTRESGHAPAIDEAPSSARKPANHTRGGANAVARAIATHSERFDLGLLWTQLCSGHWRVSDAFCASERCYLMVEPASGRPPRWPSRGRGLRMIERVLLGESPKAIAIDLGLSASTVASAMKRTLELLGLKDCRISGIPILLVLAARAARTPRPKACAGFIAPVYQNEARAWVVSSFRPDVDLPKSLSLAEQVVLRLLMEGRGHHEIARVRGTSTRTVANQLSTVFRKLGVSGRAQAVDHLAARALSEEAARSEAPSPADRLATPASSPESEGQRSASPNGFSQSGFFDRSGAAGVALDAGAAPGATGEPAPGGEFKAGTEGTRGAAEPVAASAGVSRVTWTLPFVLPEPGARGVVLSLATAGRGPGGTGVVSAGASAGFSAGFSDESGSRAPLTAGGAFAVAKDWIAK